MADREENVYKAKLAEQAERYDEMTTEMKKVASEDRELTIEERNLLSVAYKNYISARRSSWRVLAHEEEKERDKPDEDRERQIKKYKAQIENEIRKCCTEVTDLVQLKAKQCATDPEAVVFYKKMQADYCRYMAEVSMGHDRKEAAASALEAYKTADEAAEKLEPTHPIRLGLALNYSVFFYEIMNNPARACVKAKTAFEDAIANLDNLPDDIYKDSTLIMQLLRDNLTLWTGDLPEQNNAGELEDLEQTQQEAS